MTTLERLKARMDRAYAALARLSDAKEFGPRYISPDRLDARQTEYDRAADAYHTARREAGS